MVPIKYVKLREGAHIPTKAHEDDAGFDLYASEDFALKSHSYGCVPTALSIELPQGYEAQVRPRSGLAAKHGVTVLISSHNMYEVENLCDRVAMINHGELILCGTPRELKEQFDANNLEEVFIKAVRK